MWALGNYNIITYLLNWIASPCSAKQDSYLIQGVLKFFCSMYGCFVVAKHKQYLTYNLP